MPLYAVSTKGSDKLRLIDATSESAALKHAAAGQFTARRITRPTEVGELMGAGATVEKAGTPVTPPPAAERVNVETGDFERSLGDLGGTTRWEVVRPATLSELTLAEPGGTWRVHSESGMVGFLPEGSDEADGWHDIREATAEEIAEATPAASDPPPAKPTKK